MHGLTVVGIERLFEPIASLTGPVGVVLKMFSSVLPGRTVDLFCSLPAGLLFVS